MRRQCCMCKRVYENGRWDNPLDSLDPANITHGFCEECLELYLRSIADYFSGVETKCAALYLDS